MNTTISVFKTMFKKKSFSFIVLFFAIVAYRIYILLNFGFIYTDSDQSIMWLATKDYANGYFHEPFFYGQAYNLMVESFLSVPFYWLGIPLKIALPIVTTLLTILPFFILARIALRKGETTAAVIILTLLAALPVEYDLHTSLSRGFVSGISLFSLFFLFAKHNIYILNKKDFFLLLLISSISYIATPNSLLLSGPVFFYALLIHYKSGLFYFASMLGLVLGIIIYKLCTYFYFIHPNFELHGYEMTLSLEKLYSAVNNLDSYFKLVTPIFWNQGFLTLIFPVLLSFLFFKQKKNELAIVSLSVPLAIFATLTLSKIHDGNNSIFFHISRMYLAVPVLLSYLLLQAQIVNKKLMNLLLLFSLIFLLIKSINLHESIKENLSKNPIVMVIKTKVLERDCDLIAKYAKHENVELIIFSTTTNSLLYNYGCPSCTYDFPNTVYPIYERRTWRLIEDENKVYRNVLIFDDVNHLNNKYDFIKKAENLKNAYLIKNNKRSTSEIYKDIGIQPRFF